MASTNYYNTFIQVAEDCAAESGQAPPRSEGEPTVARLEYELLSGHDYVLTSDDVLFAVHVAKHDVPREEQARARAAFFARSQACLRSSPLVKRYGWGIHFDWEGRIALHGRETADYERLASDWTVRQLKAMRSRRA